VVFMNLESLVYFEIINQFVFIFVLQGLDNRRVFPVHRLVTGLFVLGNTQMGPLLFFNCFFVFTVHPHAFRWILLSGRCRWLRVSKGSEVGKRVLFLEHKMFWIFVPDRNTVLQPALRSSHLSFSDRPGM
jgi:hypothetical protein